MNKIASIVLTAWMSVTAASAQAMPQGADQTKPQAEISVGYTFVRSNAPPAECSCFHWHGGDIAGKIGIAPRWSLIGSFEGFHANSQGTPSLHPTMFNYLIGFRRDVVSDKRRVVPFGKLMFGGAYGYDGYYVTTDSEATIAMKTGGGVDIHLGRHWAVRPIEVDYLWTHFKNGVNDSQNNLQLSTGMVYFFHAR